MKIEEKYKDELLTLDAYLDGGKVMYMSENITLTGECTDHGFCTIEPIEKLMWKLKNITIQENSPVIEKSELLELISNAVQNVVDTAKEFKNKGNTQIYTMVAHTTHNGTEYQVQVVLNPCKSTWSELNEVNRVDIDSIKV
jgi:hypothetical protein